MTECLSQDEILRYVASTAADLDLAPFERHIDGCEACRRNVAGVVRANRNSAPRIEGAISDGTRIGRYVIRAVRGSGAMGHVFEASDPDLDRTIAIKIVHNTNAIDDTRALREGRALARLTHPNVVAVYDVGIWSGGVFLAMELVRGTTVREWAAGTRSWREIVRVFAAVARGLHAAHGAGLVHRDIKPENLVVGDDGRVRVIDFGLAIDDTTEGAAIGGTPAYMAPEQRAALARGSNVDALGSTVASSPPGGAHLASLGGPDVAAGTERPRGGDSRVALGSTEIAPPPVAHRSASAVVADARSDQYAFMVSLFESLEGKRPDPDVSFGRGSPSWLRALIKRGLREAPDARHADMAVIARELERGLGIRRRRAIIAGSAALAVALAIAFAVVVRSTIPPPLGPTCTNGSDRLAGIWDAPRKQSIRTALLATRKAYAADAWRGVEQTLDRYTAQWTASYSETCEATHVRGEQSAELLDLRMACLDEHLQHLRSLGDALAAGGPDIARSAVKAALALEPLDRCSNAAALRAIVRPPTDPAARKRIDDARLRLSQAMALLEAGNLASAGSLADAIPEVRFAPLDAERLLLLGRARRTAGEFDGALAAFRASAREADAGGADTVRINALVELIDVTGIRKGQHEQALEIAKDADALVLRMGRPPLARALLFRARGSVLGRMQRSAEAVADLRNALADFELALGKDHLQSATTHNVLGNALYREGRIDDAVTSYRRALAIREAALGPMHPDTGGVISNLGSVLLNRRDFAGAEAAFRRARTIAIASLGPDHPDVALYHINVALTLTQQRRFADALPDWQAAERLYTRKYGTKFHPDYVQAITGLAMARLGLEQPKAALADAQRAYELTQPHEKDAGSAVLADLRFTLARAMWEANVDRARARQHAIWARDVWAKGGPLKADELAEAEAWLRSRTP